MTAQPLTIFVSHCSDLLTDHLPHGDGLTAYGFITNLAKRGHQLHVAAQKVALRDPLPPNVTLYEIPLKNGSAVFSRLEYMVRVRLLLNKLRKHIDFDLIHQMNPVFTGLSLSLIGTDLPLVLGTYVARWPNDPDALSSRGGMLGKLASACRDGLSSMQQKQADALLMTSDAAWNRLPDPNAVRGHIYSLRHGLDTQLFSPAPGWDSDAALRADQASPSILFYANVYKRKGIFTLIDALPMVARQVPGVKLRIAGDGVDLPEARRRVAVLDCAGQVEFLGKQERSAGTALYRAASVYCLPSFGEPYAATVMEAMSCGKPLVVANAGGLPSLVSRNGGRLFAAGDAGDLASALVELLRDPELRRDMGRHNRADALATLSWDKVAQRLEEIYREVLSKTLKNRNKRSPAMARRPLESRSSAIVEQV